MTLETGPNAANINSPASQSIAKARIWVIASYRAGENSQVFGLVDRLNLPWKRIDLKYHRHAGLISFCRLINPAGIANLEELSLGPPWPELIISSGMKNEPFCRWIAKQSQGKTRLVFIGRTWAAVKNFSLLITTPQYRVSPASNVIENHVTLHGIKPAALEKAKTQFSERFKIQRVPRIVVLVGGNSGPHYFGPQTARHLASQLSVLKANNGGSIIVSTSSRTPGASATALRDALAPEDQFYQWHPNDPDNPYMGLMAWADQIVVTSDSVAMMSEAAATEKPVFIYDLDSSGENKVRLKSRIYRWVMRYGPSRASRDLKRFHEGYIGQGFGTWLGCNEAPSAKSPQIEIERTVDRVKNLLSDAKGHQVIP